MTSIKIKIAGTEYIFECQGLSHAIAILTDFYGVEDLVQSFEAA